MLLDNKPCGAGSEGVLITAEISCRAGFTYCSGDLPRSSRAPTDHPYAEDVTFTVGYGDYAVRRDFDGASNSSSVGSRCRPVSSRCASVHP